VGTDLQHHSSHVRASYCTRVHAKDGTFGWRGDRSDASDASDASFHMSPSRACVCARARGSYLFVRQKRQTWSTLNKVFGLLRNSREFHQSVDTPTTGNFQPAHRGGVSKFKAMGRPTGWDIRFQNVEIKYSFTIDRLIGRRTIKTKKPILPAVR
jgi:hypothetical protein